MMQSLVPACWSGAANQSTAGWVPSSPRLSPAWVVGRDFKHTVPPSVVILIRPFFFFSELHGEGKSERRKSKKEEWSDECRGCTVGVCVWVCDWLDMEPSRLVDSLLVTVGVFFPPLISPCVFPHACASSDQLISLLQILLQQRASDILNPPFPDWTRLTVLFYSPSCGEDITFVVFFVPVSSKNLTVATRKENCYFCTQHTVNSLIVWEVCECSLVVSHKHAGRIHGNRHKHMQTLEDDRVACSKCVVHVLLMRTQFSEVTCQKAPFKYSFGHARALSHSTVWICQVDWSR